MYYRNFLLYYFIKPFRIGGLLSAFVIMLLVLGHIVFSP